MSSIPLRREGELDPEIELALSGFEARRNALPDTSIATLRQFAETWRTLMGDGEEVASVSNGFVHGPHGDIPIRLYRPACAGEEALPAMVYAHGGGWMLNNIDIVDAPARLLANSSGCVIVSVNYHKAPEHPFPLPLDDVLAVFDDVTRRAPELGIDPLRIGLAGDSSGANLALGAAVAASERRGARPAFLVLAYPALDPTLSTASMQTYGEGQYLLSAAAMRFYWDGYVPDSADWNDPRVNPLCAESLAELPTTLLILPACDPLRDEGRELVERLHDNGVPVVVREYEGAVHGLMWMAGVSELARWAFRNLGIDVKYVTGLSRSVGP